MMVKLVEIIPTLRTKNGAEALFVDLCEELSRRDNVELSIIILYDEVCDELRSRMEKLSSHLYFCHKHKGIDLKCSRIFKKILNSIKPNTIHTHNCCFFTYFFAFGFKKQNWKYYHTCHNVPKGEATKLEHFFRKIFALKKLMHNIGISSKISELFSLKYNVELIPYVVNGIKLDNIEKHDCKYDFINVARFNKEKNHIFLLRLFSEIHKTNNNVRMVLLGDGPEFQTCLEFVRNNNLNDAVLMPGKVSNVKDYMSKSRIFIMPSLYEGVPISILEAMNCGLPIIASNVGGIPDIVANNINGFLIEPNNFQSFLSLSLKLLCDGREYSKMSKNNKIEVEKYSIEKCVDNYLNIFESEFYENN